MLFGKCGFRAELPDVTTYFVADTPSEIIFVGSFVRAIPIRPTQLVSGQPGTAVRGRAKKLPGLHPVDV
jgi:hypothetical protein